jgi:hypothetical protein
MVGGCQSSYQTPLIIAVLADKALCSSLGPWVSARRRDWHRGFIFCHTERWAFRLYFFSLPDTKPKTADRRVVA